MKYNLTENKLFYEITLYFIPGESKKEDHERDYMDESISRSHRKIVEYALNNDWNYFVTLTVSPNKADRYDYNLCLKKVLNYLKNYRNRVDPEFQYLIIPELHKDGAIHFHGLVNCRNNKHFSQKYYYDKKTRCRVYINDILLKNLGRNQFVAVNYNSEQIAYYISKYVSKSKDRSFKCSYFKSNGLKLSKYLVHSQDATDIYGRLFHFKIPCSFKCKYVEKYKFYKYSQDSLDDLLITLGNKYDYIIKQE